MQAETVLEELMDYLEIHPVGKLIYAAIEQRRMPDDAWSYTVLGVGALLLVLIHFVERIYRQVASLSHVAFRCLGDDDEGNMSLATLRHLRGLLGLDKSTLGATTRGSCE
jgi:hypothetical protein